MTNIGPSKDVAQLSHVSRVYPSGGKTVLALDDISSRSASARRWRSWAIRLGQDDAAESHRWLDRPTRGDVTTLGSPRRPLRARADRLRARIGLVFQDPHLLPGLSALENVVAARIPARAGSSNGRRAAPRGRRLRERMDFPPACLSARTPACGIARALLGAAPAAGG
jgi:hypothetical protein